MACPARWSTPRRDRPTWAGPKRLESLRRALGVPAWMPWQADVMATALEVEPDTGALAYPIVGLSVGRQEGKSSLIDAVLLLRSNAFMAQRSLYLCQDRQLAAERLLDLADGPARRYVATTVRSNGRERVTFRTRSRWTVAAATAKAGRGRSNDLVVVDEAALLGWPVVDAVGPTQAARTMFKPGTQLWVVSNAGDATSLMFWHYTELGRDATLVDSGAGVAWFEWGAADDDERDDPATWRAAMPSLGATISETFVATKLAELVREPERFDREYLNRWPPGMTGAGAGLDLALWAAAVTMLEPVGRAAYAFDIAADRSAATIVRATLDAGVVTVEAIDHRPGSGWVPDAVAALVGKAGVTVAADDLTCAGAIAELARRHVPVTSYGAATIGRACLAFDDALHAGTLKHRDQALLDTAVLGARRRLFGDAWAWSRTRSTTDVAPLVAATLAAWVVRDVPAPARPLVLSARP